MTNKKALNKLLSHIHFAIGYAQMLDDVDTFVLRDVLNEAEEIVIELRENER